MKQQAEQLRVPVLTAIDEPIRSCLTSFLSLYDAFCDACDVRVKVCEAGNDPQSAESLRNCKAHAKALHEQATAVAAYVRGAVPWEPRDKLAEAAALAGAAQCLFDMVIRGDEIHVVFQSVEAETRHAGSDEAKRWAQISAHFHSTKLLAKQTLLGLLAREDIEAANTDAAEAAATAAARRPAISEVSFADVTMVHINDKPFWIYYGDDEVLALLCEPAGDREDAVALKLACDSDFGPREVTPLTLGALRALTWSFGCQAFVNITAKYEFIVGRKFSSPMSATVVRRAA